MSHQVQLTHDSFADFARLHKFALIHFWATWNQHDSQQRRIIESEMPDDLSRRVAFGAFEVDSTEHHPICAQHKVMNIPFLAFYRSGSLIRINTGALDAEVLIQYLRELIEEPRL
jgi:thioredoxin-like negative regulator of GroEL